MYLNFNQQETNTIIAALRLYAQFHKVESTIHVPSDLAKAIIDIATDGGTRDALNYECIEDVADTINDLDMTPRVLVIVDGGIAYPEVSDREVETFVWDRDNFDASPYDTEPVPYAFRHMAPHDAAVEDRWAFYIASDEVADQRSEFNLGPCSSIPRKWLKYTGVLVAKSTEGSKMLIAPTVLRQTTYSYIGITLESYGWRTFDRDSPFEGREDFTKVAFPKEPDKFCIPKPI